MKSFTLSMTVLLLSTLSVACDIKSIDKDSSFKHQNDEQDTHDLNHNKDVKSKLSEVDEVQIDTVSSEWEPRVIQTPVGQQHKSFLMPKENIEKIKSYFYNTVDAKQVKEKQLEENDYILYGYIRYLDDTVLEYDFRKGDREYSGHRFGFGGNYKTNEDFSEFNKHIIYKMLDASGIDSPQVFFQELINSPKITKYKGCTVQLKKAKYGMIDLTSCKEDNLTSLSLYNPELKQQLD